MRRSSILIAMTLLLLLGSGVALAAPGGPQGNGRGPEVTTDQTGPGGERGNSAQRGPSSGTEGASVSVSESLTPVATTIPAATATLVATPTPGTSTTDPVDDGRGKPANKNEPPGQTVRDEPPGQTVRNEGPGQADKNEPSGQTVRDDPPGQEVRDEAGDRQADATESTDVADADEEEDKPASEPGSRRRAVSGEIFGAGSTGFDVVRPSGTIHVVMTEDTEITGKDLTGDAAVDLAEGTRISVVGTRDEEGNLVARRVHVIPGDGSEDDLDEDDPTAPTPTPGATVQPTATAMPTAPATALPTATATALPTATATALPTATATLLPTATAQASTQSQ